MATDIKDILRHHKEMQATRRLRESEWQQIADVFLPTKNFTIQTVKGAPMPRKIMTSVPQKALARSAAMFIGFLIDPLRPFILPNVKQGLINAGRGLSLGNAEQDYLGRLAWQVRDWMMSSRSGFRSSLARVALELMAFGTAVLWTGHRRGFGPVYMSRPLRQCWIDIDDDDQVNRLHFEWKMPLWQVYQRWPDTAKLNPTLEKWRQEERGMEKTVRMLHCVFPRGATGERGAVASNKPYAEVIFAEDAPELALSEGGYDDFPFAVPRFRVAEGNPYGQGFAWMALPDALELNQLQQLVEYGVGQRVAPTTFVPQRLFGRHLDRRFGSVVPYDPKLLGFQSLQQAVQVIQSGGDIGIGSDYMKLLQANIEDCFMIDWMRLPEHAGMTATEVNDRKQLRAVGLTGTIGPVERDLFGVTGDRSLDIMGKENMIAPPPDKLGGVGVWWDYAGPLAMAQQQAMVDSVQRLFELGQIATAAKPTAAEVIIYDEGLRLSAQALGLPPAIVMSMQDAAALRAREAEAVQQQREAQNTQAAAQALQAGGGGLESLSRAAQAGAADDIRQPQMAAAA